MNKDYGEIENKMLLYKSKETIVKEHTELLKRIDKAIEYIEKEQITYEHPIEPYQVVEIEDILDILKEVE